MKNTYGWICIFSDWCELQMIQFTLSFIFKLVKEDCSEHFLSKTKKKRKRRGDPEAVINLTNLTITVLTALPFIFKGQKNWPWAIISKTFTGANWATCWYNMPGNYAWQSCKKSFVLLLLYLYKTGLGFQCRKMINSHWNISRNLTSYKLFRNGKIRLKWITVKFENGRSDFLVLTLLSTYISRSGTLYMWKIINKG